MNRVSEKPVPVQSSCDDCSKLLTPAALPMSIPCGDTDPATLEGRGLPDSFYEPEAWEKKDCGGNGWWADSQVHFFSTYHVKSPTQGGILGNDHPLFGWVYKYVTGTTKGMACGGHDYPSAGTIQHLIAHAGVESARDFAAYDTGQGVQCYDLNEARSAVE